MNELTLLAPEDELRPVQIMDFQPDPKGGSPKIILLESSFQRIVEKSGNRPIAVVGIAGPSNKGKSVFLNFVLRYLKAKKKDTTDWMGWLDPPQPLKGFSWRNGDATTKGIWIWSEPISYKANGEDVDVYIMDTQGVLDESLGQRESSILVGLSMLTSSLFIFNIAQDFQEDTLQFLQTSLSFGLYALKQDESDENLKPFQKLVFLIHDWEKLNEYPHGGEGGQKYIQKKLECKEAHSEDQRRVRQQMKACFEDVSCYLFPHPGKETRDVSFTGAMNSTPKFRQFAKMVELCIVKLMDGANLPVKKLHGNLLTGGDLLALFKGYTELFNAQESPSAESFYTLSMGNCTAAVVRQCVDAFTTQVDSEFIEHDCMDDDELEIKLMSAEKTALILFDERRKMGDETTIQAARSELINRIGEKSELLRSRNKVKNSEIQNKIDEESKRVTQAFNNQMECKLFGNIVTSKALNNVHKEALFLAKSTLQNALKPFKLSPAMASATQKALEASTDIKAWEKKTKEMNESIETEMEKLMATAQKNYQQAMNPKQFTSVDDFWKAHAKLRSSCLAQLMSSTKLLSKTALTEYGEKLATKLETMCDTYLRQLNKLMDDLKEKIELYHWSCIQLYSSSMDKMLRPSGQNPVNTEKLTTYHQESVSAAVTGLKSCLGSMSNQLKDPEACLTSAHSRLMKELNEKYKEYQQRNKSRLDNFEATARNYSS